MKWKPLPPDLPPAARSLAEHLRALKDASGFSLADLAAKTHYSRASWERWLNGKRVITPEALDRFTAVVASDRDTVRALLDSVRRETGSEDPAPVPGDGATVGETTGSPAVDPDAHEAQLEPPAETPSANSAETHRRWAQGLRNGSPRLLAALSAALLAAAALVGGVAWLLVHGSPRRAQAHAAATAPAAPTTEGVQCQGIGCLGKDPQQSGCDSDARTLTTANDGQVVLYVRYSSRCGAAWAKITNGSPGDTAVISTGSGERATALIHWGYDNYSPMVPAAGPDVTLRVCGSQPAGQACTSTVMSPNA